MSEKKSSKPSMTGKLHNRVESGTCNVCSAPCSSCMHLKLSRMGSKVAEFSDENCHVTATSQNSVNEDDVLLFNNGTYDSLLQHTTEASNLLSENSSHDSLSENMDGKANIRSSDVADGSAESKVLLKSSFGGANQHSAWGILGQKIFCNIREHPKIIEGHDDNISCVSRANCVGTAIIHFDKNADSKNLSRSSTLDSLLGLEGSGKALLFPKSESLEMLSNNADSRSPKVQSMCLSSPMNGQRPEKNTQQDLHNFSSQLYPKLEIELRTDHQADGGSKYSKQVGKDEKSSLLVELPATEEPNLQSLSGVDGDDSEIVEHDVKVCDICGDTGREDLLATCSRCIDGAEHTYCMREMRQRVPEDDWLCEECKLSEETENQKRDAEGMNKARQSSIKRLIETVDLSPALKRQAVERSFGSPKSSSPTRSSSLSRDSSFKGLDKGKEKLAHQTSFVKQTGFHNTETARSSSIVSRLQPSKGALLKSNSFNIINSQAKEKLVDEFPQKLKSSRDLDVKEGSARMFSKSMTFRTMNSTHSSATDSKIKMLSPKFSQSQEIKGLKHVNERGAFESKTLSKLDRPLGISVTISSSVFVPKVNQKLTPYGESAITLSTSNNKEPKASQSDRKSGSLLRSNGVIARKGAENAVTSVRSLSMNGVSTASVEQKLNQVTLKDEPSSSSSWTAERPSNNLDENMQDGLSQSREASSQSERSRESSDNLSKPATAGGLKNLSCKGTGDTAELDTIIIHRALDTSGLTNVKEEMSKGSKLKAAIEAAILKKPRYFRKKKESDQSGGFSSLTMDAISEIASVDQFSSSNKTKNFVPDDGADEGQADLGTCSLENCKQRNINNMKQGNVHSGEAIFPVKAGDSGSMVKSSHTLAAAPFSKMLTIPEHECIWQGAFEIRRGGKVFELYGGLQAHLSTRASPKVLEVVNHFPYKISLDEVPRLSTWPRQFHDNGPKEYNIALYFFAKDLESYEKSYKNLLDNMIKKDLALKGSFDDVEFLIFSSTQLPENSKRWNMLFFLWGVFRGRRSNGLEPVTNSVIPVFSAMPLDMNTPDMTDTSLNGNLDSNVCTSETKVEQLDCRPDSIPSSKCVTGNAPLSSEIRCSGTSQEEAAPDCRPDLKNPPSVQETVNTIGSNFRRMDMEPSCVDEELSFIKAIHTADHDEGPRSSSIGEEKMVDRMEVDTDEAIIERDLNADFVSLDVKTSAGTDLEVKQPSNWQFHNRKRPLLDLEKPVDIFDDASPKIAWATTKDLFVNGESYYKKLKSGSCEKYATGEDPFHDGLDSHLCDSGFGSSIKEKICEKVADEKVVLEDVGAPERYFFPVDTHLIKDNRLGDNLIPWKEYSSNDEDQFHEGVPNLELALGAEIKPQNKGIVPFFVGMVEKNNTQIETLETATEKEEEASLSLSLSFPFSDKEQDVKPVLKKEQLLPERPHVNTSLLLFRDFPDK